MDSAGYSTCSTQRTATTKYETHLRQEGHRTRLQGIQNLLVSRHAGSQATWVQIEYRDGITPDDNWFICPHPRCQNLYVATAGSYHGWKFLPIVGEYVVQMLQGTLDKESLERWSWDRPLDRPKPTPHRPDTEWREFEPIGAAKL